MNLPPKVLQTLAAAVAAVAIGGCGIAPSWRAPKSGENPDKSGNTNGPDREQPGKFCQPDGCPGCGMG